MKEFGSELESRRKQSEQTAWDPHVKGRSPQRCEPGDHGRGARGSPEQVR